ncbi:MAG: hypothetical protein E7316_07445 [Clostridiales bacterium]|nr:hypothetical protein [Clostridiales bacterium]
MRVFLLLLMGWMLLRPGTAMDAAGAACHLFVTSVLPGLFPYMTFSLMLVSRMDGSLPGWLLMLLGWCGGSPTGARLMAQRGLRDKRLAVSCATMSPMFLLGTLGSWLRSPAAGVCILASVVLGGWLTGLMVQGGGTAVAMRRSTPLSFGEAVTAAAKTMLMVCGTMVMLRVLAALATEVTNGLLPWLTLPLTTLLEVTTGTYVMAELPLPLPLRTALMAGAAGMGGAAILMQNRACYPEGFMPLPEQAAWQVLHGAISFVLALGLMLLWT